MTRSLFLDGDSILHTSAQANAGEVWWDDHNRMGWLNVRTALEEVITRVENLASLAQVDITKTHVLIGPEDKSQNFRRTLWPAYKAHRRAADVPIGLGELRNRLRAVGAAPFDVYTSINTLEADDELGICMTEPWFVEEERVLWSPDKDLRQVPGLHLIETEESGHPAGTIMEITRERADYWHLYQTLTGDQSDGYPGLPGVGPVKAEKILAVDPALRWVAVVAAYMKAGLTEADALLQARIARITRYGDTPGEWKP